MKIVRTGWEHIPGSNQKKFIIIIQCSGNPLDRADVLGKTELEAYALAERYYGV